MSVPPTLLSTFEVLFSPQLPTGIPVPVPVAQIDENVVKGYFLTISNPNTTAYRFNVAFHCNTNPASPPPSRTLANAVGFLDDGTTAIPLTISPGATAADFFVVCTVAARGTVLIGIIPQFFNSTGFTPPVIDCRGWVEITLPAVIKYVPPVFRFVAQSNQPVPIIVTPEQRLTFVPVPGTPATTVEAQSAFALPVAGGSASLSVPPQPPFVLLDPPLAQNLETVASGAADHLAAMAPSEHFALLSALVASAPSVTSGKRAPDDMLKQLGFNAGG